jgi:MoaA/NifB/PqqE/SkfB family radical SAM enzyme
MPELRSIIEKLIQWSRKNSGYLAESPDKLRNIAQYYSAFYGLNPFPYKKCNAPWVSVVVEADGSVRPCFFHPVNGNIRTEALKDIINSEESIRFRRQLDMTSNSTCVKCVCSLNLSPGKKLN